MAGYRRRGVVVLLSASMAAGAANAQALQRTEVLGNWTLRMTPAEGANVTVKTDSGRVEMALSVTPRGPSGIACALDGAPTDCQLRRGGLVVTMRTDGARMIYTLNGRRTGGFTGNVRLSANLIPVGSIHLGTMDMVRR